MPKQSEFSIYIVMTDLYDVLGLSQKENDCVHKQCKECAPSMSMSIGSNSFKSFSFLIEHSLNKYTLAINYMQ